jgi:hypothetical protein
MAKLTYGVYWYDFMDDDGEFVGECDTPEEAIIVVHEHAKANGKFPDDYQIRLMGWI